LTGAKAVAPLDRQRNASCAKAGLNSKLASTMGYYTFLALFNRNLADSYDVTDNSLASLSNGIF